MDYAIINSSLVPLVQSFSVHNLDLYSDHCPISLVLKSYHKDDYDTHQSVQNTANDLYNNIHKRCTNPDLHSAPSSKLLWIDSNIDMFTAKLNSSRPQIPDIQLRSISSDDIDNIINSFMGQIIQLAITSGFAKSVTPKNTSQNSHSNHCNQTLLYIWFDDECRSMKKHVSSKLSAWKNNKTNLQYRKDYYDARKAWKNTIRAKKTAAKQKWNNEILKKASSDLKASWRSLKSKPKSIANNITSTQWEEYF